MARSPARRSAEAALSIIPGGLSRDVGERAVEIVQPGQQSVPVIYASPHSGRRYLPSFLKMSRLDRHALRQSEDGYVDLLFEGAPAGGAPLLKALFPRAYVDVNRARNELDPRMFADELPPTVDARSSRVRAGLGVIPRIVADGHDIYGKKLRHAEARRRLAACYDPYHDTLSALISQTLTRFGCALLIDCHSMPSVSGPYPGDEPALDIVLGDRYGSSCSGAVTALVENVLFSKGYSVSRNAPYAGGYVASAYGRPESGVHVLQIEINRALYLDERRYARHAGFQRLRRDLDDVIAAIATIPALSLRPAKAAE